MAKAISVTDALAVLVDSGFQFGDEHKEMIGALISETFKAQAVAILAGDEKHTGKLIGEKGHKSAEEWADVLFSFGEDFANEFVGEVKNVQGGAERMVRMVGIDIPAGHLRVELKSNAPGEES